MMKLHSFRPSSLRRLAAGLTLVLAAAAPAAADVKLPALFSDNMMLQAGQPVPVWGTADPNEAVEVRVTATKTKAGEGAASAEAATQTQRTTADAQGHWKITLAPLPATDEPIGFTVTGNNKITIENAIIGEVWICSGQSNMEWNVRAANNAPQEIAAADFPDIRLFQVPNVVSSDAPKADVQARWEVCSPKTVPNFSAVGFFFARTLRDATDKPVGLIQSDWGGTPVEAWTSREKLDATAEAAPVVGRWKELDEQFAAAKASGGKPKDGRGPDNPHHPAGLFNGMIAPLVPYAVKGAIWYQGESNAGRAYQYRSLFPAMINDWRERWGQEQFTFLFVQLANYQARKDQPGPSAWAELREAQSMTLKLPMTGQAVTIDIGEATDIHPKNKQDVGKRLALAALKVSYGEDVVFSGPTYKDMKIDGKKVTLTFDNVGSGLDAKGGQLKGFAVAGKDRQFHWADAEIDGEKVVVSSAEVPDPVAVRYAWADNPEATLYNGDGLPASPFRTDDWPSITAKNVAP